jgi:signal transduction histidine kinase
MRVTLPFASAYPAESPIYPVAGGDAVMTIASDRPRRTAVWVLTGVAVAAALGFLAWRAVGSSDGASIPFYSQAWTADGVATVGSSEPSNGLRAGDHITAVDGRSVGAWIEGAIDPRMDRSALAGDRVTYTVLRDGALVDVPVRPAPQDPSPILLEFWSAILFVVVLQGLAVFVLLRRPEASASVALAIAAVGVTGSTIPWLLGLQVSDIVRGWPFALYGLTSGGLYMLLWPAGALHLPLALERGASSPRRRALALAYGLPLGGYIAAMIATRLTTASATAWIGTWPTVQLVVIIPTILAGFVLSIRGFRRATAAVRQQVRWVTIGGATAAVTSLVLMLVPELLTGRPFVPWSAVGLIALPLPLGISAAILRSRLFDIDVVVNRTLVYGGATASIVAIYAVAVTFLGSFLRIEGGFPASLLATGLAAVAAIPIRDGLQRTVNRLMYGDRDDPYRGLARLGRRLEGTLDPVEAPAVIVRTIAESLRVPWVGLRIGSAEQPGRTIEFGSRPIGTVTATPLVYGSEVVGDLLVAPRSPSEPLSAADRALLEALARQAGAAVHGVRLTLDLIESREHLVVAREEERRRIRRDLHDGLGPTLAAIGMRAEVAAELAANDPAGAERVLAEMRVEVQGALAEIRRLVDALRPPALDELGLVGALQAQAGRLGPEPIVDVAARGTLHDLPAAIEVAAYRIAVEAMTNAARHARARSCHVRLSEAGKLDSARSLEVEITDDGAGIARDVRPGIGLLSMRERASEVGGTCVVEASPDGGTRVFARLPLAGLAPSPTG